VGRVDVVAERARRRYAVRAADLDDLEAVCRLVLSSVEELDGAPEPDIAESMQAALAEELGSGATLFLLATCAAEPCGIVALNLLEHPFLERGSAAAVSKLWVEPRHRRTGVAALLLAECVRWARERGAPQLLGSIATGNERAASLAAALGMRPKMNTWQLEMEDRDG